MKRFILVCIGLATIVGLSAVRMANAETILAHRYDFENNANDSVGTLNGTVSAGDTYVADSKSGSSSLLTAAAGGWVDVPAYDFTNQFSIALWLKPSASDPSSIQTILANSNGGYSTDGIRLYYNSWNTTDHALTLETGDSDIHTGSGAITVGAWNQVVVTVDKTTGTGLLYVNGSLQTTTGGINASVNTNGNWRIGSFLDDAFPLQGGNVDDVQVYTGVLAPEQVKYLNDHPGTALPEPSTMVLLGIGAVSLLAYAWRKRR